MASRLRAAITTTAAFLALVSIGAPSALASDGSFQTGDTVGDGFAVIPAGTRIYNVNHHDPVRVECRELVDGTRCPGYPFRYPSKAETGLAPHGVLDAETGRLWVAAQAPGATKDLGFACIDVGKGAKVAPASCGWVRTSTGQFSNDNDAGGSIHSGDEYNGRLYAIDTSGAINCVDMAAKAACTGQPFDVGLPDSDVAGTNLTRIGDTSKFIARTNPAGYITGPSSVVCFDAATNAICAGWSGPVSFGTAWTTVNASVISAQTAGVWDTFCGILGTDLPFANAGSGSLTVACLKLADGTTESVPPGLGGAALTDNTPGWQFGVAGLAEADTSGTRVYFALTRFTSLNTLAMNDRLVCYDFAARAVCPGYPNDYFGGTDGGADSKTYATTVDASGGCVWTLGDPGIAVHRKADAPSERCYPWAGKPGPPTGGVTTPTTTPTNTPTRKVATAPASVGCVENRLILTDVYPNAGRTRLIGVAPSAAAGKKVRLISAWNGKTVATPTVKANLTFAATVKLPPKRLRSGNRARYSARFGSERSLVLKFGRRMYTRSITQKGTKLTLKGWVTKPFDRPVRKVVIRASASCSNIRKGKIVATVKLTRQGKFTARFAPPAGLTTVYLRAETRVRRYAKRKFTSRTFTLIRGVKVGG